MDLSEPRPRHRGSFISSSEGADSDPGDEAAAEGVTIRVRFIRPRIKRRVAGLGRRTTLRVPRASGRVLAVRRPSS
jgi:hypothetical protein